MARSYRRHARNNEGRCRRNRPAHRAHRAAVNRVVRALVVGACYADSHTMPDLKRVSGEYWGTGYLRSTGEADVDAIHARVLRRWW